MNLPKFNPFFFSRLTQFCEFIHDFLVCKMRKDKFEIMFYQSAAYMSHILSTVGWIIGFSIFLDEKFPWTMELSIAAVERTCGTFLPSEKWNFNALLAVWCTDYGRGAYKMGYLFVYLQSVINRSSVKSRDWINGSCTEYGGVCVQCT